MALTEVFLLFFFSPWPGACVGAWALTTGVVIEALASRLMAGKMIPGSPILAPKDLVSAPRVLTYRAIDVFSSPLALTSMLALGINPVISYFLAPKQMAIEWFTVLPVLQSPGAYFHELRFVLPGSYHRLTGRPPGELGNSSRRFALGLLFLYGQPFCAFYSFLALFSLLWLQRISGLTPELASFC